MIQRIGAILAPIITVIVGVLINLSPMTIAIVTIIVAFPASLYSRSLLLHDKLADKCLVYHFNNKNNFILYNYPQHTVQIIGFYKLQGQSALNFTNNDSELKLSLFELHGDSILSVRVLKDEPFNEYSFVIALIEREINYIAQNNPETLIEEIEPDELQNVCKSFGLTPRLCELNFKMEDETKVWNQIPEEPETITDLQKKFEKVNDIKEVKNKPDEVDQEKIEMNFHPFSNNDLSNDEVIEEKRIEKQQSESNSIPELQPALELLQPEPPKAQTKSSKIFRIKKNPTLDTFIDKTTLLPSSDNFIISKLTKIFNKLQQDVQEKQDNKNQYTFTQKKVSARMATRDIIIFLESLAELNASQLNLIAQERDRLQHYITKNLNLTENKSLNPDTHWDYLQGAVEIVTVILKLLT